MATDQETVLVTGCSSGIGRATARTFLEEGWRVYATSRDPDDVSGLAAMGCETAALDVTDDDQVAAVVDRVVDETGRVDCLVNNAGYAQFGPTEDVPVEQVQRQFDVNVFGPHRLARAVLPHMRERGEGTVVNVSSVAGRVSFPMGGAYCASKFAMEAMTDALRPEVAGQNVDVVLVEPGPVETGFSERADEEIATIDRTDVYESFYDMYDDSQVIGGDGLGAIPPQEVANAVVNAATTIGPAARYPVGRLARYGVLARFVPDSWRDFGFRLAARLAR